jgi:hypothetical protein
MSPTKTLLKFTIAATLAVFFVPSARCGPLDNAIETLDLPGQNLLDIVEPAAESGNPLGEYLLARIYMDGKEIPKDETRASGWFARALESSLDTAGKGDMRAQFVLGSMYRYGYGIPADAEKAAFWYSKAAEHGYIPALNNLGVMYKNGEGVLRSSKTALSLLARAEAGGSLAAKINLAVIYLFGESVQPDEEKAAWLLQKPAADGYAQAQFMTGYMIEKGLHFKQDDNIASAWYAMAAAQGFVPGKSFKTTALWKTAADAAVKTSPVPPPPDNAVETPSFATSSDTARYALVIGISDYKKLPPATYADRDALTIKKYLLALGYPENNIGVLINEDAALDRIKEKMDKWLAVNVSSASTVFVYYAGLGTADEKGAPALVAWDARPLRLEKADIPLAAFYDALEKLPAKRIMAALDTSFVPNAKRFTPASDKTPPLLPLTRPGGKITVFVPSQEQQSVGFLELRKHGMFTYNFLKGLNAPAPAAPKPAPTAPVATPASAPAAVAASTATEANAATAPQPAAQTAVSASTATTSAAPRRRWRRRVKKAPAQTPAPDTDSSN